MRIQSGMLNWEGLRRACGGTQKHKYTQVFLHGCAESAACWKRVFRTRKYPRARNSLEPMSSRNYCALRNALRHMRTART